MISYLSPFLHSLGEMIAINPFAINRDLGREQGLSESARIIQDKSHPDEAMEVTESRVLGWAASFGTA